MFVYYFDFFINCIKEIFETMKQFPLFRGFTYYNFVIFLMAIPIIMKLISFIFAIEDAEPENEEKRLIWKMQRYDEIKLHDNLRIKEEKDMNRRL